MRINSTLYYVLTDHLGSASVVTNASGSIVGEQGYYPFGETRFTTGTMYTDKLYTGQREITGLGIYHYNARFYSPKLGRFLSADTIVPGFANPQNLNRFSYVGNSPINYTDPSGHIRLREGPQQDRFSQSVADAYRPRPIRSGRKHNNNRDTSHNQNPLLPSVSSYNYAAGTNQIPLYQSSNLSYDISITGQYGIIYSNDSNTTISLYPPNIRETLPYENGLSSNFTVNPSQEFTTGYGQTLLGEEMSSLSGFNLNPITGAYTARTVVSSGPLSMTSSLRVEVTLRPAEAAAEATIKAGLVAVFLYFASPTPEKAVIPVYVGCKAAGVC